jgi:signal transduction histidine kinase
MVSTVDALVLTGVLAGGVVCWLGYRVYRQSSRLGRRSFVAFTATLGLGCIVAGVAGAVPSVVPLDSVGTTWTELPLLFWFVSTIPWFFFALQYTGTRTSVSFLTGVLVSLPYSLIFLQIAADTGGLALNLLASAAFIYVISLVVGGSYLLLQTTHSYGHVSLAQGISVVVVPVGTLTVWNVMGVPSQTTPVTVAGAFAAGAWLAALGLGAALFRYDLFETSPSVGTLGERAVTGETDDLMFVVDDDDRVITINETAVETLETTRPDALGNPLAGVLAHDTEELRQSETVAVGTVEGTRQYDPQVSTVSDHHDNAIGTVVSLRDVTDRQLREQRLAVLNRVLRHNLRNEVDVVKSHAEALDGDGDGDGEHVASIVDAADAIETLGRQANRIDQYVSEPATAEVVDLAAVVTSVLEAVGTDEADVTVTVDVPASATVVTKRGAVASALRSALDNAVAYADSTVSVTAERRSDGYAVRVDDDGPGIPQWELDSLDTGTESPLEHTTGLGLWQLKWAVMTLNGELSFDTEAGTTVEIFVPDLRRKAEGEGQEPTG